MSGQKGSALVKQSLVFLPVCILPEGCYTDGERVWGGGPLCGEEIGVLAALIKIAMTYMP